MSDPRWHDADSSNPRDGRASGAPNRHQGMPDQGRTRDPWADGRDSAGWDDPAVQTRRMQPPPELRGRDGTGGSPARGAARPGTAAGTGRGRRGQAGGRPVRRRGGARGAFGRMPAAMGIAIIAGSAVIGCLITIVQKRDPGTALGVCVVLGTLLAGLAVRPGSAYVLLPVPALSYVVAALIAGKIHDPSGATRLTQLLHAGTWLADGFVSMVAASLVAVVIVGMRLFVDWRGNASARGPRRPSGGPARPGNPPRRPGDAPPLPEPADQRGSTSTLPRYGQAGPTGPPGPSGPPGPAGPAGPPGPRHGDGRPRYGTSGAQPYGSGNGSAGLPGPTGPYGSPQYGGQAGGSHRPARPDR